MTSMLFVGAWFGFLAGFVAGLSLFNFVIYPHRVRRLRLAWSLAKAEGRQP